MIYGHVISESIPTSAGDKTDLLVNYKSWSFLGFDEFGKRKFECVFCFYEGFQNYLDEEAPLKVPNLEKRFIFTCAVNKELTETEINNEIANHLATQYTLAPVTI